MSSEMRDFMAASSGYDGGPQDRHSCIVLVDMTKNVLLGQFSDYRVPTGGMQVLSDRLRDEFIKLGGEVYTNTPVTGMANCSSGSAAEHHQALLTAAGKPFCSKSVILALHEGALEKLWWRTLSMETAWKAAIPGEASKLFLGFDKPWWREAPFGFYEGAEVSSLDIEHTYFIGTQADHVSANTSTGQSNRNSLVLASYAVAFPAYRWANMEATKANISAFQGRANAFVGSETPLVPNATGFTVSQHMVDLAMHQLHQLHNVNAGTIPPPYTAAAIHWPVSWHNWGIGANPSEVIRKVGQLDAYQNVFICGEAYSKSQGWAEGALRSAEYILEEYFNLKPLAGMPTKWLSRYR
ncbi:aplysianin-A-like [Sycon ciliatum]|uniref:aplysianin-A-like n=1 Tax=Sycon ciliatum TaxID=27933 RepID=UPI0031F62427